MHHLLRHEEGFCEPAAQLENAIGALQRLQLFIHRAALQVEDPIRQFVLRSPTQQVHTALHETWQVGDGPAHTPDDPGYVHGNINGLTFYRDSLFIVGGFDTIDGDTMNFVAQYVELSHTENCGPINSLIEHAMPDPPLTIHPNPTRDRIHLQWSTAGMEQLQVTDLLGQVILQQRVGPAQRSLLLDLSAAQAGSYLLKMQGTRTMHAVFIKE